MLKDSFYRQICQALEGSLDPLVFERCMGDLLRADYPWIVPVSGGTDSGMDGAIADGEGEPFPLVCTTAVDVLRNLTRSLDSYLDSKLPRRTVVLATSRSLTTRKRNNLYKRAREKGFELQQIFDREAVADRLTGSRRWCKELLDLAWKPSALSTVPPTSRPLIDIEPIGREADLTWIEGTSGDRVLSGEPGSGKTFLFRYLMRKRNWPGLFLAESDLIQFRDAWVEQRPKIVVVDDAHIDPDLLLRLVRLREEMDTSFEIVASTWEGGREAVVEALGVPAIRVRKLELLTRDEILQVILQVGVQASNDVLRDLVSQAANKPGLAVTIASLWLQGSYEEVIKGTALTQTLTNFFRRFLGPGATDVLACLALGGDHGMSLEAVGTFLRLTLPGIREIASGLAAAGVLSHLDQDILAVWPRKLRFTLLRSVFFPATPTPVRLDYRDLLDLAPSREKAIETIVAAKLHGAEIPNDELHMLVAQSGARELWQGLAYLSEADALWVLRNYPGAIEEIAEAVLREASEPSILRLLERAETVSVPTYSRPFPPIRLIRAWVEELDISPDEMVRRRRLLARVAKRYLREGGGRSVGLQGICLAFSPSLEGVSTDPGSGGTVTELYGLLPLEQLKEVTSIWTEVRDDFSGIEAEDWPLLSSFLWSWMHPSYASRGGAVSEDRERLMRDFAVGALKDLAPLAQGRPALIAKVRGLAKSIDLDLKLEPDPVFDLLFPSTSDWFPDWKRHETEWESSLEELACQWASRVPGEITELLVGYEKEAQRIGQGSSVSGLLEVCGRLAMQVHAPEVWLDALLAQGASGVLTGPFLKRLIEAGRDGWEHQAERFLCLETQHACSAVEAIVRLPSAPADLLSIALDRLTEFPHLLERLCVRRLVPIEPLKALFHDPRPEVALTAAVGEWNADQEKGVRPELAADWRFALFRVRVDQPAAEELGSSLWHMLGVILSKDADLAYDWLVARLRDPERPYSTYEHSPYALALSALGKNQRLHLVDELEQGQVPKGFVRLLVERDPEVFKRALSSENLREHHLEPLGFLPDDTWMELALLALDGKHEPDNIVQAALWPTGRVRIMSVTGLEHWKEYEQAFAHFAMDPREQVREIARYGQQLAAEEHQAAEKRARQFAIHGRYV